MAQINTSEYPCHTYIQYRIELNRAIQYVLIEMCSAGLWSSEHHEMHYVLTEC